MNKIKSIWTFFLLVLTLTSCDGISKWNGQWESDSGHIVVKIDSKTMKVNVRIPSEGICYTTEWSVVDANNIVWQGSFTAFSQLYTMLNFDGYTFYYNPMLDQELGATAVVLHKK